MRYPYYADLLDSFGVSVCSGFIFIFAFIVGLVFPYMVLALELSGAFAIFLGLSVFCFLYLIFYAVETKGKKQEEIYAAFDVNKLRELNDIEHIELKIQGDGDHIE